MPKIYFIAVFLVIFSASCKKDITTTSVNVNAENSLLSNVSDISGQWFATYGYFDSNYRYVATDTLHEDSLINNGYLSFPRKSSDLLGTINFNIPDEYDLYGDSISFAFTVRDSSADQMFEMIGSDGFLEVEHYNQNLWGIRALAFGVYQVGNYYQPFTSFTNVLIVLKGNRVTVYTDDRIVFQYSNYRASNDGKPLIGKLKSIVLKNSTYMKCDNVALFNSYTKKLLMKENFNLKGKSNTIFY